MFGSRETTAPGWWYEATICPLQHGGSQLVQMPVELRKLGSVISGSKQWLKAGYEWRIYHITKGSVSIRGLKFDVGITYSTRVRKKALMGALK